MELSSLLHDLHLPSSSDEPLPSPPPITELLSQLQKKLISASSDAETISLIGHVEHFFQTADPHWLFSIIEDSGWLELQTRYSSVVDALIGCAALPLCEDDCNSLPAAAYQSVPGRAVAVCSTLKVLLGTLGNGSAQRDLLLAVAPAVCVFTITHVQDQLWTSAASRAAAQSLQGKLLMVGGWREPAHLLMGEVSQENTGILGEVLDLLQPQLTKDLWQRCEAVKFVFVWVLQQVTHPFLSTHLPRLLAPSLLLNDNYRPENCILGVRCLHHIVLNVPAAELRQWNRAEVLYQALFKHLYTTDATVIQPVLLCLLDLLLVLEKPPSSLAPSSSRRKFCRHDDVLRLILTHMEAEHKVVLRRVYASALPLYIDRMGVAICRHLQQLERVLLGYLDIRDPPEESSRMKVLEVLQNITRIAWPRMACRVNVLLRCLLKMLLEVSSDSDLGVALRNRLMNEATACIKLLDSCCHGNLQILLQQLDSTCCSSDVLSCLATVTVRTDACESEYQHSAMGTELLPVSQS